MDSLAKTVQRSTDPVRPLLHLISKLDDDELSADEIRQSALDSILLSLHGASVLETRRKKLLFGDNKVVSAVFDRKVEKPLLSAAEQAELDEIYTQEKHKKKLYSVLGARSDRPPRRPTPGGAAQRSQPAGVNFGDGQQSRDRGRGKFRQSERGHGKGRGRGSGEARGAGDASAQNK